MLKNIDFVSKNLSLKLRDNWYPQEGLFWWEEDHEAPSYRYGGLSGAEVQQGRRQYGRQRIWVAPLTSELFYILSDAVQSFDLWFEKDGTVNIESHMVVADTLPDALAKVWLQMAAKQEKPLNDLIKSKPNKRPYRKGW